MSLALFSFDLLLLTIFISKFWDEILLCWFIWFVMILVARDVSVTCLILPCSNIWNIWMDYIFDTEDILDTEDVSVNQVVPCLVIGYHKKVKIMSYCQHHWSNNHTILWEKLKIIWKNLKWPWLADYIQISQKGKKKGSWAGVFCQILGITAYALGNYFNFKSKFSFNNGSERNTWLF